MKFSYNWLREMVSNVSVPAPELGRLITMKTAECEGVERIAGHLTAVAPAVVLAVEEIAGRSHNRKVRVRSMRYGERTVVCGAENCRVGLITAYLPPGTELDGKLIATTVIDGVESEGMLASAAELGISRDHSGILELQEEKFTLEPDWIIEIENKSLTHRPDLWGHYGMAREVAAILGSTLRDPVPAGDLAVGKASIVVKSEDLRLCPRYSALVCENVTVLPSPLWLQWRLQSVDLNPINNIVDVTNYVLAELPQPMHAFDADKLRGNSVTARPAREGETLFALNGETYKLDPSMIVIADEGGPIAIGGVIGGMESSITLTTRRIVLESANFHAASVRKTSTRLKLRTDASMRFEKALDPENTLRGLRRAAALLAEVSPGIRFLGFADVYEKLPHPAPITLSLDWVNRKLGTEIAKAEVHKILVSLGFGVEDVSGGQISVTVPSWRAMKDITVKDDLVEEIGRMIGYASIAPMPPMVPAVAPPRNAQHQFEHHTRSMVAAQGFHEAFNHSFWSNDLAQRFGLDPDTLLRVTNPISSDQNLLRNSLVPGIWKNLIENSKHFDSFRIFEIGNEIHRRSSGLPQESLRFAAAIFSRDDGQASLFELKRLAECLLPALKMAPAEHTRVFEHPRRTFEARLEANPIGRVFEFHPDFIEHGRGAVLELDMAALQSAQVLDQKYEPLRRFPTSSFDLSVLAPVGQYAGNIEAELRKYGGQSLVAIQFLRRFTDPPVPAGMQSLSYRLTIGASDRTLTADEIGEVRQAIIDGLERSGYEFRS